MKNKPNFRNFGLILGVTVGIIFVVLAGIHLHANNAKYQNRTDKSAATEPVTIAMGQVVLRIPKNYFLALPNHDIEGRPDGLEFILLGLMPDFEPKIDANRAEFAAFNGLGRKLDIFVSYKGYTKTGKDLFQTAYNRMARRPDTGELYLSRGPVKDGEFGYKFFEINRDDWLFQGSVDEPKNFIECNSKEQVVPPGEKPLPYFPHCERIVLVGEDIVVKFSFSRDFLGNAHGVEAQMIDVLNRFRVSGPALEVIR